VQPEPVSPELVLIDPELARRERARLEEKAYLQEVLDVVALRRAVDAGSPPDEETRRRRPGWRDIATVSRQRVLPAALLCSLLANGLLVADLVARKGDEATQVAVRMVTLTASTSTTAQPTSVVPAEKPKSKSRRVPPTKAISKAPTKASVEQRVVSLILSAPRRKLPRDFVDPTTGLVKNNVQVICEQREHQSFLCAVRLPSESANKPLYVRYRTRENGKGVFTWYGRS
jgi:hypothetical protein